MNNVAKHARASKVGITITPHRNEVSLTIRDDGCGFDQRQRFGTGRRGLGIVGMRERAALAGGALAITSKPGAGTTVRVTMPLSTQRWPRAIDINPNDE